MSRSLVNFSVNGEKPMQPVTGFDGPSTFFSDASQASENSFLTPQSEVPESFLELGGHSRPEISSGVDSDILLNSNDGVTRDEVPEAPLLCLDPSTGLHVLVHNLCQTIHQPPEPQVDVTPEQFVVVWALQSEEEPMVLEKSLEKTEKKESVLSEPTDVGSILDSPVMSVETSTARSDSVVSQIFSSSIEPSLDVGIDLPSSKSIENNQVTCQEGSSHIQELNTNRVVEKIEEKNPSMINCTVASILTLPVAGEEKSSTPGPQLQSDMLMEAVPHISLEEIIEKFTRESDHTLHELGSEKSGSLISEKKEQIEPIRTESLCLQGNSVSSHGMNNALVKERSNVTVKLKTSTNTCIAEDSLDEESFYDILMTYKCKLCSEVFIDKARLMKHYGEVHKSKKGLKIYVTSENVGLYCGNKQKMLALNSNNNTQKLKDLSLMTCRHCSRTFLGTEELQLHISNEHPTKLRKSNKKKKGKIILSLPTQPGLLFSHRESRVSAQGEPDDEKNENQKRRIKAPKSLDEQYFLQKHRPKPVLASEKEKVVKCSVGHCRYRFTSEENVKIHEKCHRQTGNSGEKYYFCCECSERFMKWGLCQMHLWKVHGIDVDLLTCGICHTYKTDGEIKLIIHQKIHSDVREYVCNVCDKAFRQHAQLLNHEVIHIRNEEALPQCHQKAYCTECDKWFGDKRKLKKHMNNIHLKVKRHSCPHCPYKCTRKYDLGLHIRKHTKEKPHQCELCGHWFRNQVTVRHHKRIHFLIKLFKCPQVNCTYETSREPHFKKHISKHHQKETLLYRCQTCSLEVADLRKYMHHVTVHEEQLFKEAKAKRANSVALPSTSLELDGIDVRLPAQSLTAGEADNINIRIEAVDDISSIKDVDITSSHISSIKDVDITSSHIGHSLMDCKQKAFVFEAGVIQDNSHNSDTVNSGSQDLPVKLPSNISGTLDNTTIKEKVVDEHNSRLSLMNGETVNPFTNIRSESQVFTINVDNLASADNFLKRAESCNLVPVSYDLQKTTEHQETKFNEVMEENLFESSSHDSSLLTVQKENHLKSKIIGDSRKADIVLNVIESTERASMIDVDEGNQALITLSQVMTNDGHQYIIGISPEEIAASQDNIFALGQNDHS